MDATTTSVAAVQGADDSLGLYVHWPFCRAKCPYCDFNSHVVATIDQTAWRDALLRELDHFGALSAGRRLATVFFGGGTPSLMPPAIVDALLARLADHWHVAGDLEVTLEANPTSAEAGRLVDFRAAGINRLSLGVQSFDDAELRFLGRQHGAAEAQAAIAMAHQIFDHVSFDLIYALPDQTLAQWTRTLDTALRMVGEHISAYQLTIEKGTPFHAAHRAGAWRVPDDALALGMFALCQEKLADAGLPAYEVSNHARPGRACRHNLGYWLYRDYVGIGPGAHGRLTHAGDAVATVQRRAPDAWLRTVQAHGHGTRRQEPLDRATRFSELLLMGLRLSDGIPEQRFAAVVGGPPESWLAREQLARLQRKGLVIRDQRGLRATPTGLRVLDSVVAALLP